jgi:tRNA (guanine37-N1)-methyltransferase
MKIALITLFPEMLEAVTRFGVSGRAVKNEVVEINCFNPREFAEDLHKTVDDRPYGGGPGMVMQIEPLRLAIGAAREWIGGETLVVYLSPQGALLDQKAVNSFSNLESLVLVAGRYEGIDERLIGLEVDQEWSIGDYVLSGGELPAMVLIDALARQIPGVLGHDLSASQDSFSEGLLDCPHYTRPECFDGQDVPKVLLSGDHGKIRRWRLQQSLMRTQQRRPDLMDRLELNAEQKNILKEMRNALADDGNG